MFRIIVFGSFMLVTIISGAYTRWEKYYPTILYTIIGSLLYLILYADAPLWYFRPEPPWNLLKNNTLISITHAFVVMVCTVLLYLKYFPNDTKKYLYVGAWVFLYMIIEYIALKHNLIVHQNGWNLGWSLFFNVCMFVFIRLHHSNPLLTLGLTALFLAFIGFVFGIPAIR